MTFRSPPPSPLPVYLGLGLVLPWLLVVFGIAVPLIAWNEWYDPLPWKTYNTPWPDAATTFRVNMICVALIGIPLFWVVKQRTLDVLTLALAQEALIFSGYYYLGTTADRQLDVSRAIIQASGLMVLVNFVGFCSFFSAFGVTYSAVLLGEYKLSPLSAPAAIMDGYLVQYIRVLSLITATGIATPMILTHEVPLLSSNGTESRLDMIMDSDFGRAVYHFGTALLPFVIATLIMVMLRDPKRIFGWDGIITVAIAFLQLLTSNRLPLSIALMVTLCLGTMQYRLPRFVLAATMFGYLFAFTFLSGFSSLLRLDPQALQKDWFGNSMQAAYLGDNIIDLRDGAWVLSQWDYKPLMGKTYLGGAFSMLPSGLFPQKKQWHLGLTGVRIVGMPDDEHFGLRITFFGESFLNFGFAGTVMLGILLGTFYAVVIRQIHVASQRKEAPCLTRNVILIMTLQCAAPLNNTSDAFIFWVLLTVLLTIYLFVVLPARRAAKALLIVGENS